MTNRLKELAEIVCSSDIKVYWPVVFLLALIVGSVSLLLFLGHPENIPSLMVSIVALAFAYMAYFYTKERFRLDLLDRRFEVYQDLLKFCSIVVTLGGLSNSDSDWENLQKAYAAAEGSFRGLGFHKIRTLFGKDIHDLVTKMNGSYSWLIAFHTPPSENVEDWADKESKNLKFLFETAQNLPDIFKPYVYFGDYRTKV